MDPLKRAASIPQLGLITPACCRALRLVIANVPVLIKPGGLAGPITRNGHIDGSRRAAVSGLDVNIRAVAE